MDNNITIICKMRDGEKIEIGIRPDETIKDLEEAINNEKGLKAIELYFKGKHLDPKKTIFQLGLKNNDVVDVKDISGRVEEAFVVHKEAPIEAKEIILNF